MDSDWTKHIYQFDVIFVRHAESYNNTLYQEIRDDLGECSDAVFSLEETKRRQSDSTLSKRGFEQVMKLRSFLKRGGWSGIIKNKRRWVALSSPMKRCLLTADAVHNDVGIPVTVDPTLYETGGAYDANGAALPGVSEADIVRDYPGYSCKPGMENGFFANRSHKETDPEFDERAFGIANMIWSACCDSVQARKSGATDSLEGMVIVAHGNLLSAVINCLLTQSKTPRTGLFVHENSGFSHIELHYDAMRGRKAIAMKQLNEYSHLAAQTDSETQENPMRCGNHTTDDHWIQEFLV